MNRPVPLPVCLTAETPEMLGGLTPLAELVEGSPSLSLLSTCTSEAVRVQVNAGNVFQLFEPDTTEPIASYKIKGNIAKQVTALLEHLAAFRNFAALQAPDNGLRGVIKVRFGKLIRAADRRRPPQYEGLVPDEAHGEVALKSGENLTIAITNPTDRPLYVYLVALNGMQRSASRLYPYSETSTRLKPAESMVIGGGPDYLITMGLPPGCRSGLDLMKVFLSHSAIDLDVLSMPEFGSGYRLPSDQFGTGSRLDLDLRCCLSAQPLPPGTQLSETDLWTLVEQPVRIRVN
ncbi:hypothetical protein [Leptolyngbya sp. FACHB-261]|uniref:hypothetical protein n=1 Tax=Leptolyngbya sp. FACHB-261 TaxID=2692806 RepID=UPI00168332E2|nr:hypothetical protein [Leptolyngbya sp. FACHB-261]MBD2103319.1 hypothetical protein [Leptolyngbya sp. FACHB-261]